MDYIKILKRAFQITRSYKVLWVFGIILALTAGGNPGGNGGDGSGGSGGVPGGQFPGGRLSPELINGLIAAAIALICLFIILGLLFSVLRYLSQTALIRMVDQHEATGEKVSVREGFRLGWTRASLRIFLIDLMVFVVMFVAFLLLFAIALAPLLTLLTNNDMARVLGIVSTVGMAILLIFLTILAGIIISLVMNFVRRACVLENLGVFESIRRGIQLVRQRLGDVVVMAIIMFGIRLGLTIVLVPVFILLIMAAVVLGGLPAVLIWWIAGLFAQGTFPIIIAVVFGLPIFLVVLVMPMLFLSGLAEVFTSSTWTLTYREILALGSIQPEEPLSLVGESLPED